MKSAFLAVLLTVGIGLAWSFVVMAAPTTVHAGRGYKSPLDIAAIPKAPGPSSPIAIQAACRSSIMPQAR